MAKDKYSSEEDTMKEVMIQLWQQKSRGSPETESGCSLHLTLQDCTQYINEYWDEMPKVSDQAKVPNKYEAPCGNPFKIEVHERTYEKIRASKNGIRLTILLSEWGIPHEFTNLNAWKTSRFPHPFH